ncbi:hypothetical protein GN244_ATG11765 [Phytophthora infestans]|uniref:Uncharacterized protein n=1 Tax=Phytophthora infestans TaxID=4787 RepID=A0A833T3H5_PHYIN|nr:hypothetical protein GN244_ATG11765 [Phytophthora infestans]
MKEGIQEENREEASCILGFCLRAQHLPVSGLCDGLAVACPSCWTVDPYPVAANEVSPDLHMRRRQTELSADDSSDE